MEGQLVVRTNLAQLIKQKGEREGKRLTLHRLQKETGIALNTIKRWMHEAPGSYDNSVMSAFCEYFGCEIGDLLKAVDINDIPAGVGEASGTND